MRLFILHALGLAVAGCSDRPLDPEGYGGSDSDSDASATGSGTGTGTTAASTVTVSTSATSGASDTSGTSDSGEVPTELDCAPEYDWEGIVCLDKTAASCGPCDDACVASEEVWAFADEVYGGCCFFSVSTRCGPAEIDGQCCYVLSIDDCGCDGRPLVVDGARRRAAPRRAEAPSWSAALELGELGELTELGEGIDPATRARAGERWLAAALDEHASIAAFARSLLELLGVGAPASLIAATQAAIADEVEHARLCFGVAAALLGAAHEPGPLPAAATGGMRPSLVDIGVAAFVGGCVGEGIAAARAEVAAAGVEDPRLAALLRRLAADEQRHATLAWRILRWCLEVAAPPERSALRERLEGALAAASTGDVSLRVRGEGSEARLRGLGCLAPAVEGALAEEVRVAVVAPCLGALLDATAASGQATRRRARAV